MNLRQLGEVTDNTYDQEHTCSENLFPTADRIVHCISSHDVKVDSWQLHNIHYATAEEVEIGEAEFEGEITYHSMIVINYCPFCGKNLNDHK